MSDSENVPPTPALPPALRGPRDRPEYHVPEGWKGTGPLPQESAHIRRSLWRLPLVAVVFTVGVWGVVYLGSQGTAAPPGPRDLTSQFIMLHQAFEGPGVTPIEGDRRALAAGLKSSVGPYAAVPDLSAAGLVAAGARALNIGGGGLGLIRYQDRGPAPDVLAVFALPGRIGVPQGSAARDVAGAKVWLQQERTARIVYTESGGLDWALITSRDADAALAVARALLNAAPREPAPG